MNNNNEEINNLHLEKIPLDEVAIHEKHDSDEDFEEELGDDFNADDLLFDLSMLSKKDLKALRKIYPNLPEYYFKTPAEKKKYFQNLNQSYYDNLNKEKKKNHPEFKKKVNFNTDLNQTQGFYIKEKK